MSYTTKVTMPVCLKCGWEIVIGPAGCACTQAARHERKMMKAVEEGKRLDALLQSVKPEDPDALGSALSAELKEAETKAWDALARYKFQMFGYWAAIWVHLNRIGGFKKPNPWKGLVAHARRPVLER